MGTPSLMTIALSKLLPGLMDQLLARNAYEQQFTAQAIPDDRPDNLFHPAPSSFAAHGSFDERARRVSPGLWASMHRELIGAVLVGAAAMLMLGSRRARRR